MDKTKKYDVISVGSWTIYDHIFTVEKLPQPGETIKMIGSVAEIHKVYFGGCSFNNIVAAASLGAKTALISVVGKDFDGSDYQKNLQALNVDLSGVIALEDALSGHSFLFSDLNGDSICISNIGASDRQNEQTPDERILTNAKVGIINYVFDEFSLHCAEKIKNGGGKLIISGALSTSTAFMLDFLNLADILICNRFEIHELLKIIKKDDLTSLFDFGLEYLVLTKGAKGVDVYDGSGKLGEMPAIPPKAVKDPTGAGDSFAGALAAGLAFDMDILTAVRIAASASSFVVETIGCQTNAPNMEAVLNRLKKFDEEK